MNNTFIVAEKSVARKNKNNAFYIRMIIVFTFLAVLSTSLLSGINAIENKFFKTELGREIIISGFYENSIVPYYYSRETVDNIVSDENISGYKLEYSLQSNVEFNSKNSVEINSIAATAGVFGNNGFSWGRDITEADKLSAIISESEYEYLQKICGFDIKDNRVSIKFEAMEWHVEIIGIFKDENLKNELDFNIGSGLGGMNFIVSGDIGREIYDREFDVYGNKAELKILTEDSRTIPDTINSLRESLGSVNIISDYEIVKDYVELFGVINIIVLTILIALLFLVIINVHDVFSLIAVKNRYNYAVMLTQGYSRQKIVNINLVAFIINFLISLLVGLIAGLVICAIIGVSLGNLFEDFLSGFEFMPNAYLILITGAMFALSLADVALTVYYNTRIDVVKELKRGKQ